MSASPCLVLSVALCLAGTAFAGDPPPKPSGIIAPSGITAGDPSSAELEDLQIDLETLRRRLPRRGKPYEGPRTLTGDPSSWPAGLTGSRLRFWWGGGILGALATHAAAYPILTPNGMFAPGALEGVLMSLVIDVPGAFAGMLIGDLVGDTYHRRRTLQQQRSSLLAMERLRDVMRRGVKPPGESEFFPRTFGEFFRWAESPQGREEWRRFLSTEQGIRWDRDFSEALRNLYRSAPRRHGDVVHPEGRNSEGMMASVIEAHDLIAARSAPDGGPRIRRLLWDSREFVRGLSVAVLSELPWERVAPIITEGLRSPRAEVRIAAARALVDRQHPDAVPVVLEATRSADANVRAVAAYALGFLADKGDVVEALAVTLHDRRPEVRLHAAYALQQFTSLTTYPLLLDALDREAHPVIREALGSALRRRWVPSTPMLPPRIRAHGLRTCFEMFLDHMGQ